MFYYFTVGKCKKRETVRDRGERKRERARETGAGRKGRRKQQSKRAATETMVNGM
jgi:hypothetical protein